MLLFFQALARTEYRAYEERDVGNLKTTLPPWQKTIVALTVVMGGAAWTNRRDA